MNIGLFIFRLTIGLTLAAHGSQKLFGWFSGPGLDRTGQFFETLGFHPGRRHALLAGLAETGGGLLLVLGLFTPFGSAAIISVMLVAVFTIHIHKGFFAHHSGFEYNLVLAAAALALAFTGPGSLSIEALLNYRESGSLWGFAALVAGILGGITSLAQRKRASTESATATE